MRKSLSFFTLTHNVKNMKCTGLKAVSYPDTRKQIKGSTAKPRTMPVYFIFSVMGWRLITYQNERFKFCKIL